MVILSYFPREVRFLLLFATQANQRFERLTCVRNDILCWTRFLLLFATQANQRFERFAPLGMTMLGWTIWFCQISKVRFLVLFWVVIEDRPKSTLKTRLDHHSHLIKWRLKSRLISIANLRQEIWACKLFFQKQHFSTDRSYVIFDFNAILTYQR